MSKVSLIKEIADNVVANGTSMTYDQLAKHLNDTGHRTSFGTKYTGKRGVAKLISSVYKKVTAAGDTKAADKIAQAFTNNHGSHPWN